MKGTKIFLLLTAAISAACISRAYGQTQTCPRIERRGDTLFAVPADAPSYRWYKNGAVWTGQSLNFVVMDESAEYSVEVFGTSAPYGVLPRAAKLSGRVFDPLLQPVAGATVRLGNQTRTTDAQGRYVFDDANVVPGRNVVKIEKSGYFSTQTAVYFTAGAQKTAATMLHAKENPVTFHSTHGSLVHNTVFSLNIPPNAIARVDGTPHNGPVTMHYKHLSPEYPYFGFGMPGGDFLATTTSGETVTLTSYGVVGVELTDTAGNHLNLRQGATARIAMRIPGGLQNQPTAALWHFDENAGIWREETALTAKGKFLTGEVSHFSWWNMDYYGPSGTVRGRVVDCGGNPVAGAPFCINQLCWTTNENGFFMVVRVPAGQNNILTINGQTLHFTLNEGDTLDVGDINGISTLIAAGLLAWDDVNQTTLTLTVFTNGGSPPFEYSLDSLTWQSENVFPGLTGLAYSVWIREPGGCVVRIETYLQRLGAGCSLPEDTLLSSLPVYTSWISALDAYNQGLPIYRYESCENIEHVAAHFVCLRELNLSNCGLTNLPESLSNLVGLEILNLAGNPLDTVPSVVFSMPNLRILDMRWTNVPVGERAGYEANLPGVTVYWETCDELNGWI
jgi:protocatechuate 3,4-dioxygenase beta subunit